MGARRDTSEAQVRPDRERGPRGVEVLLQVPFRSEIMELPLVFITIVFGLGAMVALGRWWDH